MGMMRRFACACVAAAMAVALGPGSAWAAEGVVRVDTNERYQVMEGFGASGAWWPNWVADYPQEKRRELLELLFTERGANLSIYRYSIPAGAGKDVTDPVRRTTEIVVGEGKVDPSKDRRGVGFLKDVREMGVERFVLFANSPPAALTRNGMVSGGDRGGSNLRMEKAGEFAKYLADVAVWLKRECDLPEVTISPVNEPQWEWGKDRRNQEGCHYTPAEAAVVVRALIEEVKRRNLPFHVEAPESGKWEGSMAYAKALFDDPVINKELATFAVHSYWSNARHKREFAEAFYKAYPAKKLVMSEYCQMEHGHDLSIEGGIHLAKVVHDDLTIGKVISWQWWLSIASGGYKDGLIYAHPKTQVIEPTKRLWTLGNYSRFVRPGAVRVKADAGDSGVLATAFVDGKGGGVTVVMINEGKEEREVAVSVGGKALKGARAWVTSREENLKERKVGGTVSVPGMSVVTVRGRGNDE